MNRPALAAEHSEHKRMVHPLITMLFALALAVFLTYALDSGELERSENVVIHASYETIEKQASISDLFSASPPVSTAEQAYPASLISALSAIPAGMAKKAPLIFMIMFAGGMFGILEKSWALDAYMAYLIRISKGNAYIITAVLMTAIAAASTFFGLMSQYLAIVPIVVKLATKLGLSAVFAVGLVTVAAKIGYLASVTNPIALTVAQPLANVTIFSGASIRLLIFFAFLCTGIAYLFFHIKRFKQRSEKQETGTTGLPVKYTLIFLMLCMAAGLMGYGAIQLGWTHNQLSCIYILIAILISAFCRIGGTEAAEAFLSGMKNMALAGLLVGAAEGIRQILENSYVMDTIIHEMANWMHGNTPELTAKIMVLAQMALGIIIPSTTGKAAISIPFMGPIGHLSGLSGQNVVLAFLFGNSLISLITPTSGLLLALLAAARVRYSTWLAFILPIFLIFTAQSLIAITLAVAANFS